MSSRIIRIRPSVVLPSTTNEKRHMDLLRNDSDKLWELLLADIRRMSIYCHSDRDNGAVTSFDMYLLLAGIMFAKNRFSRSDSAIDDQTMVTTSGGTVARDLLRISGTGVDINKIADETGFFNTNSVADATPLEMEDNPHLNEESEIALPLALMPGESLAAAFRFNAGTNVIYRFNGIVDVKVTETDLG